MSTLPFIQDTHLQGVYASLDFSFLQGQVGRANQQYEQGLQEVASDYSSILNSDVTDQGNVQKKGEYVKQFQEGLKKLAGSDLSLPKNIAEAEKIMTPFWQDDKLLTDISYTKFKKGEIQKGYAAQTSKDEGVRKSYDPVSTDLLELQLNSLRTADRNESAYKDLSWDRWTPFTNVQEDLGKHKKEDGFTVSTDLRDKSGSIITVENGPSSINNYRVYADGILGNNTIKQYEVLGKLSKERQVLSLTKQGYTREQALQHVGESTYDHVRGSYETRLEAFDKTLSQKQNDLDKLNTQIARQGGIPDPGQKESRDKLQLEMQNYQDMQKQVKTNYTDFTSESGRKGFMMQPETGLAQMYRTQDIDKWAYSMSQDVKVSIKKDDAFWEGKKLDYEYKTLGETKRHNTQEEGIGWTNAQSTATNAQINAQRFLWESGQFTGGSTVAPGGRYSGQEVNQVWTPDKVDVANVKRQEVHDNIYGAIYNPNGLTSLLYQMPGDPTEVQKNVNRFTEFMDKYYKGGIELIKDTSGKYIAKGATSEQLDSYWKVAKYLQDETGIDTYNVKGAHSAMLGYTARYIEKHTKNGAMDSTEAEKLRALYTGVKQNLDIYEKDENQRKDNLLKFMKSPDAKEYNQYIAPDGKGQGRVVNTDDIKAQLEPIVTQEGILSPDDVAAAYTRGQLHVSNQANRESMGNIPGIAGKSQQSGDIITIGSQQYHLPYRFDQSASFSPLEKVLNKYGDSKQFTKAVSTINNKVIPGTEFYNKANNILGGRFTYDIDDDKHQINRDRLKELVSPGNYTTMYTADETSRPEVAPEAQGAIQNMLNNPAYKEYIGTSYNYYPSGFTGHPMAEIKIADELPKNAPESYKKLKGKTILVEKAPSASGTYVDQYPKSEDYSFHPLNRGDDITSDPIENSAGNGSYSISPYPQYNPTQYTITMTKKLMNNKTGQEQTITNTLSTPASSTNPEKLVQDVRGILMTNGANYYQNLNILRATLNSKK